MGPGIGIPGIFMPIGPERPGGGVGPFITPGSENNMRRSSFTELIGGFMPRGCDGSSAGRVNIVTSSLRPNKSFIMLSVIFLCKSSCGAPVCGCFDVKSFTKL